MAWKNKKSESISVPAFCYVIPFDKELRKSPDLAVFERRSVFETPTASSAPLMLIAARDGFKLLVVELDALFFSERKPFFGGFAFYKFGDLFFSQTFE